MKNSSHLYKYKLKLIMIIIKICYTQMHEFQYPQLVDKHEIFHKRGGHI